MSDPKPPQEIPDEPLLQRLSPARLFTMILLFLALSGYLVSRSERFQNLVHGVSQSRLSEALGVRVDFDTVDLRVLPPSVSLVNVRVSNEPALGLPADEPLLTAEEVSIGGGNSLAGGELRLGRLRALRPRLLLRQLADGRWNLPPGLSGPSRRQGGVKVKIGSLLVQQGVLDLEGRKIKVDARLEDFAAELTSTGEDRYRGILVARRGSFRLPKAEPIEAAVGLRFALDARRGITVDDLRLQGPFGKIEASGSIENLERPQTRLLVSAELSIGEVERIFHSSLGFEGDASVRARLEAPAPSGDFQVTGSLRAARAMRTPFLLQEVSATVVARPDELVAHIDRARYAGGEAQGVLRIAELTGAQVPMTLEVEAGGLSLEAFFADLGLPGTGLSGSAGLQIALRWGSEGITRADGGGGLTIAPGPAASRVAGRFGIPTQGGGPLSVVRGRIGFEGCALHFPHSTLEFTGGIPIGDWQPDFDFHFKSRDFAEADRIFQNFVAASGEKPEPLGLGGTGELIGHLERSWSNPRATAQITAEDAQYGGVVFGSARGTVDMAEGAFDFRPLRIYDGDETLSLEGVAAYRKAPGRPPFDLVIEARRFPIERVLRYLDLDLPIQGRLSGRFPLRGSKEALEGGGVAQLEDARVAGQPLSEVHGRAVLTPGRFALEEVRAPLGGGMIGGSGSFEIREKRFEARLAGDGVSLASIDRLRDYAHDVSGKLSFQCSGSGELSRPNLVVSASLADSSFFGRAIAAESQPTLAARVEEGHLEGSVAVARGFRLTASGNVFEERAPIEVSLDAPSLASLLQFSPLALPEGYGASVAAAGTLVFPTGDERLPTGAFRITRAVADFPGKPGALRVSGDIRLALDGRRLSVEPFEISGDATTLSAKGSLGLIDPADLEASLSGTIDAALLGVAMPDLALTGQVRVALAASGPPARPRLSGEVGLRNGRYRVAAISQTLDDIEGTIRFGAASATGEVDAHAKIGGGDASVAGTFGLEGLSPKDFRLTVQGRRITVRYPEDVRLVLDADLVASGGPSGNLLRGEVVVQHGTYSRDFDVTLSDLLSKSRPAVTATREQWKEKTRLEVRIVSSQALEVRNNLARLTGTMDLQARGTLAEPSLVGQVVLDEGGRVTFRDVRYEIESGTLTFASARGLAPILDVRARAEVKGYDLTVSLAGIWPRVEAAFTSDPPLSDEAIVNLLLTGSAPSTTNAPPVSGTLASTAGSIVGGAATGVFTRPAQKFFGLERFQIDPVFTSSGLAGATTTVGKQISPNWSVTYSQPLFEAGSREPVVEVEGRISQSWVLRLRHDENGVYLVDLRRRTRS